MVGSIQGSVFVSAVGSWKHWGKKMLEHRLKNKKDGRPEIQSVAGERVLL